MPPASSRDDFLVTGANRDALAMLDAPARWPQGRLLLIGGPGSGKSHLAGFWAAEHGAHIVQGWTLNPANVDELAPEGGAVVVEDGHEIGGNPQAEQGLFHLWNLCAARGCWLLLTARTPPRDWDLSLPDLRSRMSAMPLTRIEAPDEALLAAVLVKLLADRQLTAPPGLIDWLVPRMDRDLGLARRLVAALDAEAMAERRGLTRPMAADLLEQLTAN